MINTDTFLSKVSATLSNHFKTEVGLCDIHPGMLSQNEQQNLKNHSPVIYTTITDILEAGKIDSGQVKSKVKAVSLILIYNLMAKDRDKLVRSLIFKMMNILVGQKWGLDYAFPAREIKAFDLHGLLRNPNEVLGTQGWNPTLQARAKDLFGSIDRDKEPQFSIWAVTWEQELVYRPSIAPAPFEFPKTLQLMEEKSTVMPDVKALVLTEWFNETTESGRILTGTLTIIPPDTDAALIACYDLYWAGADGFRLQGTNRIKRVMANDPLSFKLPKPLEVPGNAQYIYALGKSSQGHSHKRTNVQIAGLWQAGTALNNAMTGHFSLTAGDRLFAFHNLDSNQKLLYEEYDKKTKTWTAAEASLSNITALLGMDTFGDHLYLLGKTASSFGFLAHALKAGQWETDPVEFDKDSTQKTAIAGTTVQDTYYVLTGDENGFTSGLVSYDLNSTKSISDRWLSGHNYGTDEVSPKPPAFKRKQFGICHSHNQFYLVGGQSDSAGYLKNFTAYHSIQRKWYELTAMETALRDCCCATTGMKLYVFGGETEDGKSTKNVIGYDFFTEKWTVMAPMSTARKGATAVIWNGNFYITGGTDETGKLLKSTEIYIPVGE